MLRRVTLAALAVLALVACGRPAVDQAEITPDQLAIRSWAQSFVVSATTLQSDRARVQQLLDTGCPGPAQPLVPSPGNLIRDSLRTVPAREASTGVSEVAGRDQCERANGSMLDAVYNVARADWHFRRAAATQDAQLCAKARQELSAADDFLKQARASADAVVRVANLTPAP